MFAINHISASTIRKILLGTLLLLLQRSLFAQQQYNLTNGDTVVMQLCRMGDIARFYTINTQAAYATCDAWGLVLTNSTMTVRFNHPEGVHVTISDSSGIRYSSSSIQSDTTMYGCSAPLMIYVHIDSGAIGSEYTIVTAQLEQNDCHSSFWGITASDLGGGSADLTFYTHDSLTLLSLDDGPWTLIPSDTSGMMFSRTTLNDLLCNVDHTVRLTSVADSGNHCCWVSHTFHLFICPPAYGCFEATDLHPEHVTCSYGSLINNNFVNYNIVNGRHTVMSDTTLYDPVLGGTQLRTVCPGCDSTVRLGNSGIGAQWEAIDYKVTVDTMIGAILILKYAAVLENPNHLPTDQPRFSFDLLDEYTTPVGNACDHADFVSSDSMGWNSLNNQNQIMWKDWTTVGFDLSDYHGQTLKLRFKTCDCSIGGHFGYAYFTTRCTTRNITALECGSVDSNTFTAPEGFNYQWIDSTGNVIGNSRSIRVPSDGNIYHCRVISIEDTACSFLLSTYAGTRLPKAAGSVEQILPVGCRRYDVSFKSGSYITLDGITPVPYGGLCDKVIWHFGDGSSAIEFNPTHTYTDPGTYDVTIIATLGGGQCADTAHLTVILDSVQLQAEEALVACDSLRWRDGVLYAADTLGATYLVTNPAQCDTLYTLNLHINHSSYDNLHYDTLCLGQTFLWNDTLYTMTSDSTHLTLHGTLTSVAGCDSSVILYLSTWPDIVTVPEEDTICRHQIYLWNGTLITMPSDSTRLTLCDTLTSLNGCDSIVTLHLSVYPDIVTAPEHDTICFGQGRTWIGHIINDTSQPQAMLCIALRDTITTTLGCDSIVGLDLCRWPKVDFGFSIIPNCEGNFYLLGVDRLHDSLHLFFHGDDTTTRELWLNDTLTISVDSVMTYRMTTGYTDSMFCPTDTTFTLRPIFIPEAALKLTPTQLTYENLTLHAYDISNGDYSRHWTIVHADGDSLSLPDTSAHLVYITDVGDDSTRVVLAVNNGMCADTVTGCIYLVRADFFAPNVFTPGQADNNRFVITGTGIRQHSLSIFNRQGLLVYTTDHPEEGWDGTHEGTPCMQGAYVWHLTYSSIITPNRTQTAVGTVTLLR